jgi:hypothetical protein
MTETPKDVPGAVQRAQAPSDLPTLEENAEWRAIAPLDVQRIKCDIFHVCSEQARWGTHKGPAFSYVCDYHRRVYEATGTFWDDADYQTLAPTTQKGG